jgi:predicted GNAT family N-acyltransferase
MDKSGNPGKALSWTEGDGKALLARPLKVEELDAAYALSKAHLKAGTAEQPVAKAILEYNSDAVWGVYHPEENGEKLVGFLSFLMLNDEGAELLRRGKLDVLHPEIRHLVPSGVRPAVGYIWLVVAPGLGSLAIPLVTHAMGPLYRGLPLCSTAASEAGVRVLLNFGFRPIHKNRPEVGNVFWRDGLSSTGKVDSNAPPVIHVVVVHSSDEFDQARAIRAAVYMSGQNCPYAEEFDGNDHTATHLVAYVDGEPAGTLRIRYFGWAKIERLAVLKRFRKLSVATALAETAIEFLSRKGIQLAYGHPQVHALSFWQQFGFDLIEGIEPFAFSDHRYVAVGGPLLAHPDPITMQSDPLVILRPEGEWDEPGVLDRSATRAPTDPRE